MPCLVTAAACRRDVLSITVRSLPPRRLCKATGTRTTCSEPYSQNCLFTTATILALLLLLLSMWLREFLTTLPLALTSPYGPGWFQHSTPAALPSFILFFAPCCCFVASAVVVVFFDPPGFEAFWFWRAKDSRLPRYGWAPAAALLSLRLAHTLPHAIPLQCPGSFFGVLCLRWRGYHQSTAGPACQHH